jgi:hypothetical protein
VKAWSPTLLFLLLCAGTLPQLRDIEMRYLLPASLLAAGALTRWRAGLSVTALVFS